MKRITILSVIIIVLLSVHVIAETLIVQDRYSVKLGNEDTKFIGKIYNIDDQVYVPVRELAEKMNIPVEWDEANKQVILKTDNKQVELGYNTQIDENGIIPDEETACKIGKILLEKHCGKELEYTNGDYTYHLETSYHPFDNGWRIYQDVDYKYGMVLSTGVFSPTIIINRNTGEVTYISTDLFQEK